MYSYVFFFWYNVWSCVIFKPKFIQTDMIRYNSIFFPPLKKNYFLSFVKKKKKTTFFISHLLLFLIGQIFSEFRWS